MDSTLNPKPTDLIVRYFDEIALEDEQMARTPADDAARHPPAANNIQVPGDRPWFGRSAVRGFVGLLLAACIGVAAVAWQSWENPVPPAQQSPPVVQASAATAAPPQPAPLAQTAAEGVAPTAATLSPESAQLLQSMARDLATAGHEIEQLKASIEQLKINQEQMTRDNARAAEQLKASQEQMAQVIAKASEQSLRPKDKKR
jgi:hypothetical protein